ncbi:hypothetical protein [Dyadobacter sp. Leaf189]|uniref:hypothetical protein n=1 Tax=Dyadobacter sp. Leaf189 TaxID=1736295 RepID=UPI000700CAD8|nr:hypothetical protein [Dyadobacter sp. Leaf189]KQS31545.1 hypothetical protein ASG33_11685 [Dyadobacter sp. Leaf189]
MSVVKFSAHKKFHLLQCKTNCWESTPEHLSHYRIIYVLSGEGQFVLDGRIHSYLPAGIIALKPGQQPVFDENKGTEIFVFAFDSYLATDFHTKKAMDADFADTYKHAENFCNNSRLTPGKPLRNVRDSETIHYLVNQIAFEITQRQSSHIRLIKGSMDLIVTILARNNFEVKRTEEKSTEQVLTDRIVEYLRSELNQNKTIRVPELLFKFNISEEAANLYILNRTGMSLRNFIFKYKSDLFKSRLLKVDVMELSPYLRPH